MTQPAIPVLVEKLLGTKHDGDLKRQIREQGAQAVPALLSALADPRFQKHRYKTGHSLDDQSALETILDLLDPFGPSEAARILIPLIKSRDEYVRKHVALALGNIANDDCIEPLSAALNDKDEYVVSFALMGIDRGTKAKRATAGFVKAIIVQVEQVLHRCPGYPHARHAADALLGLDEIQGTSILLGKKYWNIHNEGLKDILEQLWKHKINVPTYHLLSLESKLRPLLSASAASIIPVGAARHGGHMLKAYEWLLLMLVRAKVPETRSILHHAKQIPELEDKVAEALLILDDIPDPFAFISAHEKAVGFDGLSERQKLFSCVMPLCWMSFNAVFEAWMPDTDSEEERDKCWQEMERRYRDAHKGLLAIGATNIARSFKVAGKGEDPEEAETEAGSPENLRALLIEFARKYPAEFRPAPDKE